ncbi:MAG: DnaJ domain [Acidimicrobiales bacterium]|nr:DnaJ domain [Acidimicrobiales bacterium]
MRARALLGLRSGADAVEVERAFRDLARAAHPDRGGDPVEFQALVEARNLLRRAADRAVLVVPDVPWWRQLSPLRARRSGDDERWAG